MDEEGEAERGGDGPETAPWATKWILNDPGTPCRHYKVLKWLLNTQKEVGHAWNRLGAFIKFHVI